MLTHARTHEGSQEARRPQLPALNGARTIAALHIYFFHIKQAHDAGLLRFSALDSIPAPLARLLGRGFVSTGFFFLLSGFLVAYVYLGPSGRPRVTDRGFWRGRLARLYPLYFASLLLLIPAPALLPFTAKNPTPIEAAGGVITSLTLTQAWFPNFALWWNAPAWALSAFAFFYLVFPAFARRTAGWGRGAQLRLVVGLAAASWLPTLAYSILDPEGDALTATSITLGGPWLNALRFNPLVWLPQFLAGVALGRLFVLDVDRGRVAVGQSRGLSAGDVSAIAIVLLLAFATRIPYVALRHGLLTPLFLPVILDLARGHGLLARSLGWAGFGRMAEASFALFALQMPAGLWFVVLTLHSSEGTTLHLLGMIAWTLGLSVAWAELVKRPRARRRLRLRGGSIAPPRLRGRHDVAAIREASEADL